MLGAWERSGQPLNNRRRGRKFDQVIDGARAIFLRDGFERASVDDIARRSGVSKATLFSYSPDKQLLFMEIAKAECRRPADEAEALIHDSAPVAEVLRLAAERFVGFMISDFGARMFRVAVAESENFPAMAQAFYQSGPLMIRESLSNYLRNAVDRRELAIDDIDLAADQFIQLCKADTQGRMIFGGRGCCGPADLRRTVHGAVAMFMARYGTAVRV